MSTTPQGSTRTNRTAPRLYRELAVGDLLTNIKGVPTWMVTDLRPIELTRWGDDLEVTTRHVETGEVTVTSAGRHTWTTVYVGLDISFH